MADHALAALRQSRVKEVVILGRRAKLHAAFHNPELEELERLAGIDIEVDAGEDLFRADSLRPGERRKLRTLERLAARPKSGGRRIVMRFLGTPRALEGEDRVERMVVERNRADHDKAGNLTVHPTGQRDILECGLVVLAVGYRGAALTGLPFDGQRGVIPNRNGRVVNGDLIMPSTYVAGWAGRGSRGVIGTNRKCALQTVNALLDDLERSDPPTPRTSIDTLLRACGLAPVSRQGWDRIDRSERQAGRLAGRPRVKFSNVADMHVVAGVNEGISFNG